MDSLGFIAGVCTSSAVIPQLWHMVRIKSARDFSWHMLGLSSVGQIFWIAHGGIHHDPAVLTFASIALAVNTTFAVIKVSTSEELQCSGQSWVKWLTVPSLTPPPRMPLSSLPERAHSI